MSIPSRSAPFILPDFRNQGIWLRILLAANGLLLALVLAGNRELSRLPIELAERAAAVEPVLLLALALLFILSPRLQAMPPRKAGVLIVLMAMGVAAWVDSAIAGLFGTTGSWRLPAATGACAVLLLSWFSLRARAQAPALAEARLAALTARIRPHFFFNSLNAVLGILREDARRAEQALEELAELFRALMRENTALTLLSEEIALARKYLDIERLRLGERLQASWQVDACPDDILVPPLMLQPLLENAVHYGIEPAIEPGEICIRIAATPAAIRIEIDNPVMPGGVERHGNQMALDNLRERLMLFYDLEARLTIDIVAGRYRVMVELPIRKGEG